MSSTDKAEIEDDVFEYEGSGGMRQCISGFGRNAIIAISEDLRPAEKDEDFESSPQERLKWHVEELVRWCRHFNGKSKEQAAKLAADAEEIAALKATLLKIEMADVKQFGHDPYTAMAEMQNWAAAALAASPSTGGGGNADMKTADVQPSLFDRHWAPDSHANVYAPLDWPEPTRVIVTNDLFEPVASFDFVDRVLATAAVADRHTYIIATCFVDRLAQYIDAIEQSELWPDERRPELRDKPPLQDIGFWITESFKQRGDEFRGGAPSWADYKRGWEHPSAYHPWPLPNVTFVTTPTTEQP